MRRRQIVDVETPIAILALALPALVVAFALWLPAFALAWQQSVVTETPGALALPVPTLQADPTPATAATPFATPTATAGQAVTATATAEPNATNAPRSTLPPTATQAGLTRAETDYGLSAGLLLLGGLGLVVLLVPESRRRRATRESGERP